MIEALIAFKKKEINCNAQMRMSKNWAHQFRSGATMFILATDLLKQQ